MRLSTVLPFALAAAPAVSAAGTLGFALGVKNPDGSCKSQQDFEKDFDVMKAHAKVARTYAAADCNHVDALVPAARAKGVSVVIGIWPDLQTSFDADIRALQKVMPGNEEVIAAVTVGSESLYRGNFTGPQLLDKINQVKKLFPRTKVGTADSWNKYADGTADALILGGVDYFLVNAFSYWQGQPITNASATLFDDMMQATAHIQKLAGQRADNIYIAVGETGWPSAGGTDYGAAKAGTENAKTYHDTAVCGMLAWGFDLFFFEFLDEPWKPKSIGQNGVAADETHWGMYTADRKPKYRVECQ
ncbi:glycoside hydrolase 3 protein [Ophidiomyces ophidiicola]|nr:glycoside hydrolase 3 protein [Ophidiomyces ophidiicola]